MKKSLLLAVVLLSGCVATQYSKSISVTKDAQGNIVSTTETETVTQPPKGNFGSLPIRFKYMKDWWRADAQ